MPPPADQTRAHTYGDAVGACEQLRRYLALLDVPANLKVTSIGAGYAVTIAPLWALDALTLATALGRVFDQTPYQPLSLVRGDQTP
jgi:hypothetical protein